MTTLIVKSGDIIAAFRGYGDDTEETWEIAATGQIVDADKARSLGNVVESENLGIVDPVDAIATEKYRDYANEEWQNYYQNCMISGNEPYGTGWEPAMNLQQWMQSQHVDYLKFHGMNF
jgi:hypothetical protein